VPAEALTSAVRIDFKKPSPPVLIIAGSDDHIVPASLNRGNFAKYRRAGSITDFKEFPERCHFIVGQNNLKEVADYASSWISNVAN